MSPADTAPIRHAPLALWRVAQAFIQTLHALFGPPERVAFLHTITAQKHGVLASWLRAGEAMMRRLLLIEASAYPKPNTRPLLHERRTRVRKLMTFSPDAPEAWRVSFRNFSSPVYGGSGSREARDVGGSVTPSVACGDTSPASGGGKKQRRSREERWCAEHRPRPKFRSAWPLAERYEALLRVFNDPTAYARRLARRLHATPHRLREALHAPPEAAHRVDRFDELGEQARSVWRARFSSA